MTYRDHASWIARRDQLLARRNALAAEHERLERELAAIARPWRSFPDGDVEVPAPITGWAGDDLAELGEECERLDVEVPALEEDNRLLAFRIREAIARARPGSYRVWILIAIVIAATAAATALATSVPLPRRWHSHHRY